MTRFLDCRGTAARYFDWVAREGCRDARKPRLATVLFRPKQNPASLQYRDLMLRDAARLGIPVDGHEVGDEKSLLAIVRKLNVNRTASGLMLLPASMRAQGRGRDGPRFADEGRRGP